MNSLQEKCLEIMKEIHKICVLNDIKYSLCGGSIIGSYLYDGFIPWDDDIDVMMDRKNYEKFIDVFEKQSQAKYRLINHRTSDDVQVLYSKVEDVSTTIIEKFGGKNIASGIFVDITVMDYVPNKVRHITSCALQRYMEVYLYKSVDAHHNNKYKEKLYNLIYSKRIAKREKNLYSKFEEFCKKAKKSKQCAELMTLNLGKILYPSYIFESYILMDFEDTQFYVVEDYKRYLYCRYKKREKEEFIITPEEGKKHQHQIYYNVNIPYREFNMAQYLDYNI